MRLSWNEDQGRPADQIASSCGLGFNPVTRARAYSRTACKTPRRSGLGNQMKGSDEAYHVLFMWSLDRGVWLSLVIYQKDPKMPRREIKLAMQQAEDLEGSWIS